MWEFICEETLIIEEPPLKKIFLERKFKKKKYILSLTNQINVNYIKKNYFYICFQMKM